MTKIIADISGNHGGSLQKARDLIKAASDCGCDYVKFQYYKSSEMPDYQGNEVNYDRLAVPRNWLDRLFIFAHFTGIPLFASVFQKSGVRELEDYDPPFFKIASPESTRLANYKELVHEIRQKFPIIFSSGFTDVDEISRLARRCDILLYCPPGHPASRFSVKEIIENHYGKIRYNFQGLSDHCANLENAEAFIAMGYDWIERHLKLDDDCIDAAFSSNQKEMAELCKLAHE